MSALTLTEVALLLVRLAEDEVPKPEDVKAGWTAFAVFLLLIAAVVVLGFSLTKQLRKAQAAEDAGVYGHEPDADRPERDPAAQTDGARTDGTPDGAPGGTPDGTARGTSGGANGATNGSEPGPRPAP